MEEAVLNRTITLVVFSLISLAVLGCKPAEYVVYTKTINNCQMQDWKYPEKSGELALGTIEKNYTNQPNECPGVIVYRIQKGEHCASAVNYVNVTQMGDSCHLQIAVRKRMCSKPPPDIDDEAKVAAEILLRNLANENPVLKHIALKTYDRSVYESIDESKFKALVKAWCK